nr:mucin-19-like [Rhipicephalus microplus]
MLSTAAIYVTVLCLIPGAFSQNELLFQSENHCRRFVSPTITSALGLCTYPCLLWSNYQPPKILVISEPDGTACKVYNGFWQARQVGNCQAGFCHSTQNYGSLKRIKRDITLSASSGQPNISASEKQVQSRHGSEKPKTSRTEQIERRRRHMWKRCDCASMRGLFIDISYVVSGLRLGRRGKRERRRKVGCRVICLFLINKYKHDPKWTSLFEARFSPPSSVQLANATAALPEGNTGGVNISSNQRGSTTNKTSAVGLITVTSIRGVNDPSSIGSTGTRLTNNQTSGSSATGVLTVVPGNKAGSGVSGSSNTGAGTGSLAVGSASIGINGGTSAIPPITGNTSKDETSNITNRGTLNNSAGAGYLGNGHANLTTITAPAEGTLSSSHTGTAGTSGKPVSTTTPTSVVAIGTSSEANPQIGGSGSSLLVNAHASATGNGGISTGSVSVPSSPKNESHHGISSISAVGTSNGTSAGAATGKDSGTGSNNGVVGSTGSTKRPYQVTANATVPTRTGNGSGIASGNNDIKPLENPGTSESSTLPPKDANLSSNQQGAHGSGIGNVGNGSSKEAGTRSPSNNAGNNHSGSLITDTNVLLKPQVGSANGPSTTTFGETGSGGNIALGNKIVGRGPLEASAGGLLGKPKAGPPTNTVAGGRQNGGVSSTATPSPVSENSTSSSGNGSNIDTTNTRIVGVAISTPITGTGGKPSTTGIAINTSSSVGVSGQNASVSSGGVSSSGGGAANGISNNVGVQNEGATESSVSSANPRGEIISPTLSSSGAGVGITPEAAGTPVTGGGLPVSSTAPTNVIPTVTAGNREISGATSGTAPTGIVEVWGTSSGGTTAVISTGQPSEGGGNPNGFPEATPTGNLLDTGSRYGAGFGAGAIPGNNPLFNFGGTYGRGATGFGSTGNEIINVWGPTGSAFNRIGAGYGNTGTLGSAPGRQPFGSTGGYGGTGRFPGGIGIYDDDIFFQD